MTKTIKRSLIVVLMFVFAVTACAFTSTFTVKADTEDPAKQFADIVESWGLYDADKKYDASKLTGKTILTDIDGDSTNGDQWLIDSAEAARAQYRSAAAELDGNSEAVKAYKAVMAICEKDLATKAYLDDLNSGLKNPTHDKTIILYSERDAFNSFITEVPATGAARTYLDAKFKAADGKFTVDEIIAKVTTRYTDMETAIGAANAAITAIETFDADGNKVADNKGVALLASEESIYGENGAFKALEAIYGVDIEKIMTYEANANGDIYDESDKIKNYLPEIEIYRALKDALGKIKGDADAVAVLIKDLYAEVSVKTEDGKFLAKQAEINDLVEQYGDLPAIANNNVKAYVDAKDIVKYVDDKGTADTADDQEAQKYDYLYEGLYNDEIDYVVSIAKAFPETYKNGGISKLSLKVIEYEDAYNALNKILSGVTQKDKVLATEVSTTQTVADLYSEYSAKVTNPTFMTKAAREAIDAVTNNATDAQGNFILTVKNLELLKTAQEKYDALAGYDEAYISTEVGAERVAAYKAYQEARIDYLEAIAEWAKQVDAIYEEGVIAISNITKLDAASTAFKALGEMATKIEANTDNFQTIDLEGIIEGVEGTIAGYYAKYESELGAREALDAHIKAIADDMAGITFADPDYSYAVGTTDPVMAWISSVTSIETRYTDIVNNKVVASGFYFVYDADAQKDLIAKYAEAYENYLKAIAVRARYVIEISIEEMIIYSPNDPITFDPAKLAENVYLVADGLDILDEYYIVAIRKAYETLDLAKGGAVRNIDKLAACETVLADITKNLNDFVKAVDAMLDAEDSVNKFNLDAYETIINWIERTDDTGLTDYEEAYTGEYPELDFFGKTIKFGFSDRNVAKAISDLEELRVKVVENVDNLITDLEDVTGKWIEEGFSFDSLYNRYMALSTTQRDEDFDGVAGVSVNALRDAYQYAAGLVSTDAILKLEDRINDLELDSATKTELLNKVTELKGLVDGNKVAIDEINEMIDSLESKIADLEAADEDLQAQIDSTRTLAIVSLVIAIVGLCAAAFVIVYKVILKK